MDVFVRLCELVRYADDIVCTVRYVRDAERSEQALKNRFNRFSLEIHPEKSRRMSFGRYEAQNASNSHSTPKFSHSAYFLTKIFV